MPVFTFLQRYSYQLRKLIRQLFLFLLLHSFVEVVFHHWHFFTDSFYISLTLFLPFQNVDNTIISVLLSHFFVVCHCQVSIVRFHISILLPFYKVKNKIISFLFVTFLYRDCILSLPIVSVVSFHISPTLLHVIQIWYFLYTYNVRKVITLLFARGKDRQLLYFVKSNFYARINV